MHIREVRSQESKFVERNLDNTSRKQGVRPQSVAGQRVRWQTGRSLHR